MARYRSRGPFPSAYPQNRLYKFPGSRLASFRFSPFGLSALRVAASGSSGFPVTLRPTTGFPILLAGRRSCDFYADSVPVGLAPGRGSHVPSRYSSRTALAISSCVTWRT